jgi:hypothetical protein
MFSKLRAIEFCQNRSARKFFALPFQKKKLPFPILLGVKVHKKIVCHWYRIDAAHRDHPVLRERDAEVHRRAGQSGAFLLAGYQRSDQFANVRPDKCGFDRSRRGNNNRHRCSVAAIPGQADNIDN